MPFALITGGSRGFGSALTRALVEQGWKVVIDARDADGLRREAASIGSGVIAIPGDVTDPGHRSDLEREVQKLGGLDLLVNNASKLGPSPQPLLNDYPLDVLVDVYKTNVFAPLALVQVFLPLLQSSGGIVVNVTSDASIEGYEGWGGYGSSKAALDQLSNVLGAEQPAVRTYAFDPGDMRTQMHQEAFPDQDISDRADPATVVPALLLLLQRSPKSGRYRAADLLEEDRAAS